MTGNRVTESYVEGVLDQSTDAPAPDREAVATTHRSLHEHRVTVQTYRRLSRDEAPARL